MTTPFSIKARVYYEDTDAGGIVYHANYFKFTERARTDWLRQLEFSQQQMLLKKEGFVITRLEAQFKKSAVLDDLLTITCIPIKVRRASITFFQQVLNEKGEEIFTLTCDIAYLDLAKGQVKAMDEKSLAFAKSQVIEDLSTLRVK